MANDNDCFNVDPPLRHAESVVDLDLSGTEINKIKRADWQYLAGTYGRCFQCNYVKAKGELSKRGFILYSESSILPMIFSLKADEIMLSAFIHKVDPAEHP